MRFLLNSSVYGHLFNHLFGGILQTRGNITNSVEDYEIGEENVDYMYFFLYKTWPLYVQYEIFQPAYRQLHNTETAPLRLQHDVLQAVGTKRGFSLVLFDISATFDTMYHQKVSNSSNQSFGIRGVALNLVELYPKDQTPTIQIGSYASTPVTMKYGCLRVLYLALFNLDADFTQLH